MWIGGVGKAYPGANVNLTFFLGEYLFARDAVLFRSDGVGEDDQVFGLRHRRSLYSP